VSNLVLLLSVGLHLVDVVLGLGSNVSRVVSSVVDELLLHGEVHDVGADGVHEILGVGGLNSNEEARSA